MVDKLMYPERFPCDDEQKEPGFETACPRAFKGCGDVLVWDRVERAYRSQKNPRVTVYHYVLASDPRYEPIN